MWDESQLAKFDNLPGLRLVDYRRVGLPVYLTHIDVLIEERKSLHLLSEYCLRLIHAGVSRLDELAALLGLAQHVARVALADLLRSGAVHGDEERLSLTKDGEDLVDTLGQASCIESTWYVPVDGVLNRPYAWRRDQLHTSRQLIDLGHQTELTPFGERPSARDLHVNDVWQVLNGMRPDKNLDRLLAIRNVRQAPIRFVPAIELAYRGEKGQIQAAFLLDGRLLDQHSHAFVEKGGLKRPAFRKLADTNESAAKLRKDTRRRLLRSRSISTSPGTREPRSGVLSLLNRNAGEESVITEPRVYELPRTLRDALINARERLILTSRTVSPFFLSDTFLRSVESAAERGVDLYFGIDKDALKAGDLERATMPPNILKFIELQSRLPQLRIATLEGLDYTHLIVDDSKLVVGDYDWLAIDGSNSRTLQDRWLLESSVHEIVSRESERLLRLLSQ